MKTRVQLAGGEFGSKEKILWEGQMALFTGMPGIRIAIDDEEGVTEAYIVRQVCVELSVKSDNIEQVLYVYPHDKSKARTLMG